MDAVERVSKDLIGYLECLTSVRSNWLVLHRVQLEATRLSRQQAAQRKAEEEAAILADNKARLEAERAAAAVKAEMLREAAARTRVENEAKIRAKSEALQAQRDADNELMKANLK